jgi:hypothetical protein
MYVFPSSADVEFTTGQQHGQTVAVASPELKKAQPHTFYMTPCGTLTTSKEDYLTYDRQQLVGQHAE